MPAEQAKMGVNLVTLGATDPSDLNGDSGVCVRARAYVHVCACVHDVFAIYDNNISPGLIMIIIKVIILYFIQIRYTDNFPSTGTQLVTNNDWKMLCCKYCCR